MSWIGLPKQAKARQSTWIYVRLKKVWVETFHGKIFGQVLLSANINIIFYFRHCALWITFFFYFCPPYFRAAYYCYKVNPEDDRYALFNSARSSGSWTLPFLWLLCVFLFLFFFCVWSMLLGSVQLTHTHSPEFTHLSIYIKKSLCLREPVVYLQTLFDDRFWLFIFNHSLDKFCSPGFFPRYNSGKGVCSCLKPSESQSQIWI